MRTFIKRLLLLMMALLFVLPLTACNSVESSYNKAQKQMAAGDYAKAAETFASLGSYEDSSTLAMYCRACAAAEAGDYRTGIAALLSMGDYKDCAMRVTYYTARQLEKAAGTSDWDAMYDAQGGYEDIPLFLDSAERIAALDARIAAAKAAEYDAAVKAGDAGQYAAAIASFRHLGYYSDSSKRAAYYGIRKDEAALAGTTDQDKLIAIAKRYAEMGGYLDSAARATSVTAQADAIVADRFAQVETLIAGGKYAEAEKILKAFGTYGKDAQLATYVTICKDEAALAGTTDQDKLIAVAKRYAARGEYRDSAARAASATAQADAIVADKYAQVDALIAAGKYMEAAKILNAFGTYGSEQVSAKVDEVRLAAFAKAQTYAPLISAGDSHTVGLRVDGTVVAVGFNGFGQCNVSGWRDVVAIAAGGNHTVGLRADGTVVAVGLNDYKQCNVSGWRDVVAIAAGEKHTVGLRADGTVVAVGSNSYKQCDVSGCRDVVAIAAGDFHTVGLKADGTVVAVGRNGNNQCNVSGCRDVVAIAAGYRHTVGLKADGTVVAVGYNGNGRCDVSGWRDVVAIAAGYSHTVGLRADGTVVAVGYNGNGPCNVSGWRDVVAIAADSSHTVGLRADGTVVAVGDNDDGQCNVSSWDLLD